MIHSKKIGFINFDQKLLNDDIIAINSLKFNTQYSEYFFGNWSSCPLWNKDGISDDSMTYSYNGKAKQTQYSKKTPYLNSLIKNIFNISMLKSARIFNMTYDSFSIPHCDFLEIKKHYLRIHIPIQTGEKSYHSQGGKVFQMKSGEIWFLNASDIHSVGYFSRKPRLHLVLDFEYCQNFSKLFIKKDCYIDNFKLAEIVRDKMTDNCLNEIYSLSKTIDDKTFLDVVQYLSRLFFFKDFHANQVYIWLYEIIRRSKHYHLLERAERLEERCLLKRSTHRIHLS